jgi:hypothetical protein
MQRRANAGLTTGEATIAAATSNARARADG